MRVPLLQAMSEQIASRLILSSYAKMFDINEVAQHISRNLTLECLSKKQVKNLYVMLMVRSYLFRNSSFISKLPDKLQKAHKAYMSVPENIQFLNKLFEKLKKNFDVVDGVCYPKKGKTWQNIVNQILEFTTADIAYNDMSLILKIKAFLTCKKRKNRVKCPKTKKALKDFQKSIREWYAEIKAEIKNWNKPITVVDDAQQVEKATLIANSNNQVDEKDCCFVEFTNTNQENTTERSFNQVM